MGSVKEEVLDAPAQQSAPPVRSRPAGSANFDRWLTFGVWAAALAVVAFAAFFGYSVYAQKQADRLASPAWQVISAARAALSKNPQDAELHVRLAEALASGGYNSEAEQQLQAALRIDKQYVAAYVDLGNLALAQKKYEVSSTYWKKVLDLTSKSDMQNVNQNRELALFNLGQIALIAKDYVGAVGDFNAALRIKKDAADTYLLLAKAYRGLGDDDSALSQLEAALSFDPTYPEARFMEGEIYLSRGDKVTAAWDFRAALDGAPGQPEAQAALDALGTFDVWYDRAKGAQASSDASGALDAVRIARSISPDSYDAAMLNGRILEDAGDRAGALEAYRTALKLRSKDAAAQAAIDRVESLGK